MQLIDGFGLPLLAVETPGFADDSLPMTEAARMEDPWQARSDAGYAVTQ